MRQGNGSDLLRSNDPRSATIGIIYVTPNDDRESVLAAILIQEKLGRKQIAIVLPGQNKAFQRPIDFEGLKNMRRKLKAELIIVAPQDSSPAEFSRQRRFTYFTSLESYARSLRVEDEGSQAERRGRRPFVGRNLRTIPDDEEPNSLEPPSDVVSGISGHEQASSQIPNSVSDVAEKQYRLRPSKENLRGFDLRKVNWSKTDRSGLDLRKVDLSEANLNNAILSRADLKEANLRKADLSRADLREANLSGAYLSSASLRGADLRGANLYGAYLRVTDLRDTDLRGADLRRANFSWQDYRAEALSLTIDQSTMLSNTNLRVANLSRANLSDANLTGAELREVDLREANLSRANLSWANLSGADLRGADLTGCIIYATSAWDVNLAGTKQSSLIITNPAKTSESVITVDNLEVAQFIYLLLNNKNIRYVIDTITSKVVLILGRFTPERKGILEAMRNELRKRNYSPVLFDFEKPVSRDITETVSTLAHMARFVIADITDAKSIPQELMIIVPNLPSVPVQPLLLSSQHEYGMFEHFMRFPWVLPVYYYTDEASLLKSLKQNVIDPAEQKVQELAKRY